MSDRIGARAGSALVWTVVELAGSKLVSLLRFLVLARLLAPEEFGLLAIAAVGVELLLAFSNVGVIDAVVQRRDVDDRVLDTGWSLGIARAAAVALAVAVGAPWLAGWFDAPEAVPFLRVLALRPLVDALASAGMVTLVRRLHMRPLALMRVGGAAVDAGLSIGLAAALPHLLTETTAAGAWAVVAGSLAGAAVVAVASYRVAPHRPRWSMRAPVARELLSFGKWLLAASVVGIAGHLVLRAVVARELGVAELGVFYLGLKLTLLPNDVAGEVVRAVAFPVVSRLQSEPDRARRAFQAGLTAMAVLLAPTYAVLIALSGPLVEHVLGVEWRAMVPVIQILAIDGLVDVLADATKPLLLGLGHPQRRTYLKALRTVLVVALAAPLTGRYGLAGAAWAWLAAESVQAVASAVMARRSLARPFAGLLPRAVGIAAAAGAAGGTAWLVARWLPGATGVVAAAIVGVAAALAALAALDRRNALGLRADLARAFPAVAARMRVVEAP